ncbi:hypothetical protein [Rubellimicrobium roseum]|uniref:Uncharacterized protein n=1 Tax=Rubellimicrobium roseum TaxID=687525 RepID=A0A5C4NIC4_9RHOB|nr:hypothetical protein [Rubellimicrobium roseum]TNC72437.1 hypothetical protein FHG71_08605 [Rubellimicrobium roseum]
MTRHIDPTTRHIVDHPAPENAGLRLRHFLRLAREDGRHPAAQALDRRRREVPAEETLQPVLRMLRDRDH